MSVEALPIAAMLLALGWWRRAGERGKRSGPFIVVVGSPGAKGDAEGAICCGAAGLRSACENVAPPGDCKIDEAGGHDRGLKLCLQQSAGNSAGP